MDDDDNEMIEDVSAADTPTGVEHKWASVVVPPDEWVSDRVKTLKDNVGGYKREDNEWILFLREKLDPTRPVYQTEVLVRT